MLFKTKILLYVGIHLLTYVIFIRVLSKPHLKHSKNPDFHKYRAFARNDVHNWNVLLTMPFWLTFWPRFIFACFNTIFLSTLVVVCMIGVNDYNDLS